MAEKDPTLVYEIPIINPLDNSVRPTICFATMCKNEAHCIRETFESVYKFIDYWIVCDTGSTDDTLQVIQDYFNEKGIPGKLYQDEWTGFDHNKSMLFKRCLNQCDYVLHVDADDLIVGDFSFTKEDAGKDQYLFGNKRGASDYKAVVLWKSSLIWKWCGVAHTIVRCLNPPKGGVKQGDLSDRPYHLLSRDTGDRSNDPDKYYKDALRLREQFFRTLVDDPDGLNSRSVFYTAQSYYDSHRWDDAMQWYALYTRLKHVWFEEVYESHMRIGLAMQRKGDMKSPKIVENFQKAIKIIPERAEAYFHLGHYFNKIRDWEQGYKFLKQAYSKDHVHCKQKYVLFVNRGCYGDNVCDELSVSCYWTKRKEEGMGYLKKLIENPKFSGRQERLKRNMTFFENMGQPKPVEQPKTLDSVHAEVVKKMQKEENKVKPVITRTLAEVRAEVEAEIKKNDVVKPVITRTLAEVQAEVKAEMKKNDVVKPVQAEVKKNDVVKPVITRTLAEVRAEVEEEIRKAEILKKERDQAQARAQAHALARAQAQALAREQAEALAKVHEQKSIVQPAIAVNQEVPKMRFIN